MGLTDLGIVEGSCAAVCWRIGFRALGEAGVEDGTLDVGVRVRIYSIAWFCGLGYLEVPGTPGGYLVGGLGLFVGDWIRGVGGVA